MIIPHEQLSIEALNGLIEEFITREGTDYGMDEVPLSVKVEQIKRQLKTGDVVIAFDPTLESVSLMTKHDAKTLTSENPHS